MTITRSGINFIICAVAAAVMMGGCASRSSNVYTYEQTMRAQTVDTGTVASAKSVLIQSSQPPGAGAAIGGVTGGVLGSTVGHGPGRDVATVVGALAGAALGAVIQTDAETKDGLEIVVNLDKGGTIVVVQEADVLMYPGDRVRIITSPDGTTRISK